MSKYLSVFLSILVVFCASSVLTAKENKKMIEEIDVGSLINRVLAGEDVVGRELIVTGVALSKGKGDDGLLNLATQSTYDSGSYKNFISVYDANISTMVGSTVKVRVRVLAAESFRGSVVVINTVFQECMSCGNYVKTASDINKQTAAISKEAAVYSLPVSEISFGNDWPLTISEGVLNCEPIYEYQIVTFTVSGKTYAVNGHAHGTRAQNRGWLEIKKIWKAGKNMSPLIKKGVSLCGNS